MKRVSLLVLAALVVVLAVVVVRAASLRSLQVQGEARPDEPVDVERVAQRLALALRLRTISHQDRSRLDSRPFLELARLLSVTYPRVHRRLSIERVNGLSLLYTWKGRNPNLEPVLLAAHTDVVPVDPTSASDWRHPPFGGVVERGVIWGRGAIDDKVSVVTILEAVEDLIAEGFQPERTIYLAFGHDEEVGGDQGALAIAELLASRGVRLAFALDEGGALASGMVPGIDPIVAVVGVAEKGGVSIGLEIDGDGGHSSTPPPRTAIGELARAVVRIEDNPMPSRIDGVTESFLDALAPELPFRARLVLANRWLFGGLLEWGFRQLPPLAAMTRTTTAVTIFDAGVKENVLPIRANAVANFRIHPRDRIEDVVEHVRRTVADERVRLQVGMRSQPREPSPVSPVGAAAFVALQRTIRTVFPEAIVAPYLVVGGTDARHYARLTENVYRFSPYVMGADAMKLAHGTNEHIRLGNLTRGVRFFRQLLRDAAGPAQPSSE